MNIKSVNEAGPRLCYIMSRFPKITETFILREIVELQRLGQPAITILPLLSERQDVIHPEAEKLRSQVRYTPFISLSILSANLRFLFQKPLRYLSLLWMVLSSNVGSRNLFIGAVGIFPKSVFFSKLLQDEGIQHVHAHFATHPALSAFIISRLAGISYSVTVHAHDIFVHQAMLGEKLRLAKFVVSISDFNKRYLTRRFPDLENRIHVIHCGVDLDRYSSSDTEGATVSDRFEICCVASLQVYKGIEYLIRACAELKESIPSLHCTVVGEGEQRRHLESLIEELGLSGTVDLVGALQEDMVASHLRNADLFVLPSIVAPDGQMEGIPVALMEAMASALPVISSDISGIPELITDNESGLLVPPADHWALGEAIGFLYERPQQRKRMGAAGRRTIETEFDLSKNVSQLKSLFHKLLSTESADTDMLLAAIQSQLNASLREANRPISIVPNDAKLQNGHDSAVLGLTITDARNIEREVVVKFHRPGRIASGGRLGAETEYEALSLLWPEFEKRDDRLNVPKPLAIIPDHAAVITEKCSGRRLDALLRFNNLRRSTDLHKTFNAAGRWLKQFHSVTSHEGLRQPVLDRLQTEFVADLGACRSRGFSHGLLDSVEGYFFRNKDCLNADQGGLVSQHCDFGPHNIFVDGNEITVIDFEGMQEGFIYDDLAYFLCLLDLMPVHHLSQRQKKDLTRCFLDGYGAADSWNAEVLEFYKVPTLVKLAAHNPVFDRRRSGFGRIRSAIRLRAYSNRLSRLIS